MQYFDCKMLYKIEMNRLRFYRVLQCFCLISKTELWIDILALIKNVLFTARRYNIDVFAAWLNAMILIGSSWFKIEKLGEIRKFDKWEDFFQFIMLSFICQIRACNKLINSQSMFLLIILSEKFFEKLSLNECNSCSKPQFINFTMELCQSA